MSQTRCRMVTKAEVKRLKEDANIQKHIQSNWDAYREIAASAVSLYDRENSGFQAADLVIFMKSSISNANVVTSIESFCAKHGLQSDQFASLIARMLWEYPKIDPHNMKNLDASGS